MINNESPSAQWDAMSDQQKIEWLATKVMPWDVFDDGAALEDQHDWQVSTFPCLVREGDGEGVLMLYERINTKTVWNPLTDWNHTMQVRDAMEKKLGKTFYVWSGGNGCENTCKAAFLALSPQPQ